MESSQKPTTKQSAAPPQITYETQGPTIPNYSNDTDSSVVKAPGAQPNKWWGRMAMVLLSLLVFTMIIGTGLWFSTSDDKFDLGPVIVSIYFFPFAGALLLIGSILSIIYLFRYRPKGKDALMPIVTIAVTVMIATSVTYIYVRQVADSNKVAAQIQAKENAHEAKTLYVESIFANHGYKGSATPMFDVNSSSLGYWMEPKFVRYNKIARGSFADIEAQLTVYLSTKGFMRNDSSGGTPYYVSGNDIRLKSGYVVIRYTRNNENIAVKYQLNRLIDCPKNKVCRHVPGATPTANIYPISSYNSEQVTEFTARYTDTLNNEFSSFDANYDWVELI
jgi:hypothetical protein